MAAFLAAMQQEMAQLRVNIQAQSEGGGSSASHAAMEALVGGCDV